MEENKETLKSDKNFPFSSRPFIEDQHAEYYDFLIKDSGAWFKKVMNSMRFGWNSTVPESLFMPHCLNPVVVLGQTFKNDANNKKNSHLAFKEKLRTIPWVTYRSHFRPIFTQSGKQITTDSGWGCTIRVGQMMLLNTLRSHFNVYFGTEDPENQLNLLKLIEENLISAPYSIHNIISLGDSGKLPGEWYSSNDIFNSLIKLIQITPIPFFIPIICLDYSINKLEIYSKACEVSKSHLISSRNSISSPNNSRLIWKNTIFLMIPLMLGYRLIEERFIKTLKYFLSLPCSAGIIVDKSGSALYLIGFSGDLGIAIDPHIVKKANKNLQEFKSRAKETFSEQIVLVNLKELGPSVGVGFILKKEEEFAELVINIVENDECVQGLLVVNDERKNKDDDEDDDDYFVI